MPAAAVEYAHEPLSLFEGASRNDKSGIVALRVVPLSLPLLVVQTGGGIVHACNWG